VVAPRLDPDRIPVADVMTATPETIAPDQPLYEALNRMHDYGCRHLPVMDGEHLVGMLSLRDIPAEYRLLREKWIEAHQPMDTASA
jgi:CBS domain-containing protein